jgi:hypothetical protein
VIAMFRSILVAGACHDNDDDDDEVVMVWTEWLVLNNIKYCLHRRYAFLLFVYCFYSSLISVAPFLLRHPWRRRMMTLAEFYIFFVDERALGLSFCPCREVAST